MVIVEKMFTSPDLTVKERTLIHLYIEKEPGWGMEYPESLTQEGIAEGVGVSRAHVAQTLKSLEQEGIVEGKKNRVIGHKRKKKTYRIKDPGWERAKKLYEQLTAGELVVVDREEEERMNYEEASELTGLSVLELYRRTSDDGILDMSKLERGKMEGGEEKEGERRAETEEEETEEEKIESKDRTPLEEGQDYERGDIEEEPLSTWYEPNTAKAIIGLLLLISVPLSIIYGYPQFDQPYQEFICLYPLLAMITGLVLMASYFSTLEERNRVIEQLFSTVFFINAFTAVFLYSFQYNDITIGDLTPFIVLALSISIAIFLPFKSFEIQRGNLSFFSASFFISYGIFSFLFPAPEFSSAIALPWILMGMYMIDAGLRWFRDENWKETVLIGFSLFIVIWILFWFAETEALLKEKVIGGLWTLTGLTILSTRFLSEERRKEIYHNLWNGLPVTLSALFAFIGLLLLMSEMFIEAVVELFLSAIFVFSIIEGSTDLKTSIVWGAPLAILISLTISIFIIF